jgi:hypothetical protein
MPQKGIGGGRYTSKKIKIIVKWTQFQALILWWHEIDLDTVLLPKQYFNHQEKIANKKNGKKDRHCTETWSISVQELRECRDAHK